MAYSQRVYRTLAMTNSWRYENIWLSIHGGYVETGDGEKATGVLYR